ncbi:hypothetical protein JTB14_031285 [Gonioctena quinquepunctata]|nr:hypothetical protein JTB14_031285 [Gonioctena quinquepunctata]
MENISKDECSGSKDESNYIEIKTNILKFNVSDDPSLVPKNSSNLGKNVYVEDEEVTQRPVNYLSQSTEDDDTHKDRNLEEVIEKSTKSGRILKKPNWMSDFVFDDNSKTSKSCDKIERTGQEDRRENDPINLNGNNRFHWQDAITYAPVVQKKTMRMLFAIAAEMDWSTHQMDITAAYLSADLKDTVYMEIPEGKRCRNLIKGKQTKQDRSRVTRGRPHHSLETMEKSGMQQDDLEFCTDLCRRGSRKGEL